MSVSKHTPGPYIVRGEIDAIRPGYAMGAEPASEDGTAARDSGWPYFIREDREFPLGSGPLWLAHGIQRKADADLFAAAPDMLEAIEGLLAAYESTDPRADRAGWAMQARRAIYKAKGGKL